MHTILMHTPLKRLKTLKISTSESVCYFHKYCIKRLIVRLLSRWKPVWISTWQTNKDNIRKNAENFYD